MDRDRYHMDKEMERLEKHNRWRMLSGVGEFMGAVFGVVVILVLLALLFSLITWLNQDIRSTFTLLMGNM